MKIAITGAHRVGKTTLAETLNESLPGYELRQEPYCDLVEKGHVFSDAPTLDYFMEQLDYSFDQVSKSGNNVIFDRCPVDILAYIRVLNGAATIRSLYRKVQSALTGIDLIVYVPIEDPDVISCPESELPGLRSRVNEILNEWIRDFGIETIEVSGTLIARRDQVINKIVQDH